MRREQELEVALEEAMALRERAEAQSLVLERITTGAPLREVLELLVNTIEARSDGMLGSVLLLEEGGRTLSHGAAPSLPRAYTEAIDGLVIGPSEGSCGTAAFDDRQVVVDDIATSPLWVDYRDLAAEHGLAACWSTPIRAAGGGVLGTFALYYHEPRGPTEEELALIEEAVHLASISIERGRTLARNAHDALHDPLTGLANRALLEDRLEHALAASSRSDFRIAVLFIDLDGFKEINDERGHEAGDRALRAARQAHPRRRPPERHRGPLGRRRVRAGARERDRPAGRRAARGTREGGAARDGGGRPGGARVRGQHRHRAQRRRARHAGGPTAGRRQGDVPGEEPRALDRHRLRMDAADLRDLVHRAQQRVGDPRVEVGAPAVLDDLDRALHG